MLKEMVILSRIEPKSENLIRGLQRLQAECGSISDRGVQTAAAYFGRSAGDVEKLVAFYPQFVRSTAAKIVVEVCSGRACGKQSSPLSVWLNEEPREDLVVRKCDCLGLCAQAPVMRINGQLHTRLNREKLKRILLAFKEKTE